MREGPPGALRIRGRLYRIRLNGPSRSPAYPQDGVVKDVTPDMMTEAAKLELGML
jgi:hypothetical protein